jgi:hypothetical protein
MLGSRGDGGGGGRSSGPSDGPPSEGGDSFQATDDDVPF